MKAIKHIIILLIFSAFFTSCAEDFLSIEPNNKANDGTYWTSETAIRNFAWGFYVNHFPAFGSGWTWGTVFYGQGLSKCDDFTSATKYTDNIPSSATAWRFDYVRRANYFIDRVKNAVIPDPNPATLEHWLGVGYFFRALAYHELIKTYGDVPWYDRVLEEEDPDLYIPRTPRTEIMDQLLIDLKYAAEKVRDNDGNNAVNKYVVLAYMSRIFLFEGTFLKYHNLDQTRATKYLEAAKWAANEVIGSGKYRLNNSYQTNFNAIDLANNTEVILYREYAAGIVMHLLHSYVNKEGQTGTSADAVNSYLCKDGFPISQSSLYQGEQGTRDGRTKIGESVFVDRDPRLRLNIVDSARVSTMGAPSTSGYSCLKYWNKDLKDIAGGLSNTNITDAPLIRLAEVMLNYAEACAELGTLIQDDLDISINALRDRAGMEMPHLQVQGGLPAVGGVLINDAQRDPTVPEMIWEIRRERRVETMFEYFRLDDLKRWAKLEYTDQDKYPLINTGMYIVRNQMLNAKGDPTMDKNITLYNPNTGQTGKEADGVLEGFVIPITSGKRTLTAVELQRAYLEPIPNDQIQLYKSNGVTLTQNPGWE